MSEIILPFEAMRGKENERPIMEREVPPIPSRNVEKKDSKPESIVLPTPERKESRAETTETRPFIEFGTPPLKRPEGGFQLLVWGVAERIVLADRRRESIRNALMESIKSTERLRLAILTLEATIQRLARELYVPLFRFLLRDYRESFDALVQGKLTAERRR